MTTYMRFRLKRPSIWTIFFLPLLCLLSPLAARAQITTGSVTVRILDPNGAAVSNATVTMRNVETGLERSVTTAEDGSATIEKLPPGRYMIKVEALGFKTATAVDVIVRVSAAEERALRMEAGDVSDQVTVSSGGGVTEDLLAELPNINNDFSQLLRVAPGAAASAAALGRIVTDTKGKEQQTLRLDGLDITAQTELPSGDSALNVLDSLIKSNVALSSGKTDTLAGALTFDPPGGAERTYDLSPFYGPGTGTLVEGISLAGTDGNRSASWKFQLSEAFRNDVLNARNYFDYEGKNGLRRNQFGAKLGGPFLDGRASFFLGYDGIRSRLERILYEAVPADALCLCGGGPVAPFLGGFLPPGTSVVPGASQDSNYLVARRRARASGDGNAWDARLDLPRVTGRHSDSLTLRFTRQAAQFFVPDGVTGRRQRQRVVLANGLATFTLRMKEVYLHTFKFGVSESRSHVGIDLPPTTDPGLSQSLLTVGGTVNASNLPGGLPSVPTAALGGLTKSNGRGFGQTPVSFTLGYDFYSTRFTNYQISAGFEARLIRLKFDRFGGLTYSFPDTSALRSGIVGSANFLSDLSGPLTFNGAAEPRHAEQEYYLSYFQVTSTLSRRATITYGLRYDYFGVARERDGRTVVIDPENGVIMPESTPFYRAQKYNFQPRFGVTFQIMPNLVLRGGAGIYTGVPRIGELLLPIESDRFNTSRIGGTFPLTPVEVVRDFIQNPDTRQFQPLSFARDFTTPERVYRWDMMLTRTFRGVYDLNILYSGNVSRNLPVADIGNPIVSVQTDPDPSRKVIVRRRFDFERGGELFKPFGELLFRTSKGRSSFNGLTVQFKRNNVKLGTSENWFDWRNFRSFNAQYTLARSVGNVSGAVASVPGDFDADFGYNASDVRHNFSLSAGYRLWDDAHGRNQESILWGWTISPTVTARSGLPLIVRLDRPDVAYVDGAGKVFGSPAAGRRAVINTPGGGSTGGARVPDLLTGVNPYLRQGLQLLNPEAFAIPAPGSFGNLKRGQLRGPGSFQVDLALTRVLFNEGALFNEHGLSADLKIELTNLFNRPNFTNPLALLPNALGDQLQPGAPFTRLSAGQTFGVINAAEAGRQVQFTLTFKFNEGF
jgi:Carboxypeptidase regulatory-like domain